MVVLFGAYIDYDNEEIHATLQSQQHPITEAVFTMVLILVSALLTWLIAKYMPLPLATKTVLVETFFCIPMWSLKQELSSSLDTWYERHHESRVLADIFCICVFVLLIAIQIGLEYLLLPQPKEA